MAIKINSGWCRGLTLKSPPTSHTRPTASRTREAVWNSLQFDIQGSKIIDLFSGSGAIGLEAISRGAAQCLLIDNNFQAVTCLKSNVKQVLSRAKTQTRSPQVKVLKGDASQVLSSQKEKYWDLIWVDPPYDLVPKLLGKIAEESYKALKIGGKLIVECDEGGLGAVSVLRDSSIWYERKHKRYGKAYITILEKEGDE